jgi:hypothetical protein
MAVGLAAALAADTISTLPPIQALVANRPCGSGWAQNLLLRQGVGRADFRPCCLAHDACYGTCGANKTVCDLDILSCTADSCRTEYGNGSVPVSLGARLIRATCLSFARTGYELLQTPLADQAFGNGQASACARQARTRTLRRSM